MHRDLISTLFPLLLYPESAAGAGGGGGTGVGAGQPAGSAGAGGGPAGRPSGAGAGAGAGAGGSAPPVSLTDDTMISLGDGQAPVRYGDYRARFMPRDEYERGVAAVTRGRELLMTEAERLDQHFRNLATRAAGGRQPAQPQADPYEGLEQTEVPSGRDVAKLLRDLRQNGLGGVARVVSSLGAKVTALEQQLQQYQQQTGSLAEERNSRDFDGYIDTSLRDVAKIEIPGAPPGVQIPLDDPWLAEAARDLYISHDPKTWGRDFVPTLAKRIEGAIGFVRRLQKAAVEKRKEEARNRFFDPRRGNASPGGRPSYVHENGTQLASRFFAAQKEAQGEP